MKKFDSVRLFGSVQTSHKSKESMTRWKTIYLIVMNEIQSPTCQVPLNVAVVVVIILKYNDLFAIRMKYVTTPPLGYMN